MVKKKEPDQLPVKLVMPVAEARQKIADRIEKGKAIIEIPVSSEPGLKKVRDEYYKWSDYNHELLKHMFSNESMADEYSDFFGIGVTGKSIYEEIEDFHSDVQTKIRRLESLSERLELIPLAVTRPQGENKPAAATAQDKSKVFIVHGHDEAAREMVARFVERLNLQPIILHEQANRGKTIIEKLEHYSNVGFAIVLLTPDDEGRMKKDGAQLRDRARQNVIMELGYFIGLLGRSHVCALHRGSVEIPSDYVGVVFVPLDDGGGWRLQLAKELISADYDIDMNKAV